MMEKLVSKEELLVKHCTLVESFLSYILPFFSFIDFTPNFGRQQTEANVTNSTALSRSGVLDFSESK